VPIGAGAGPLLLRVAVQVPVVVPSSPECQFPPDLATVVGAWGRLPDSIKSAILALVRTTGGANA
jgi:hypothetical protein